MCCCGFLLASIGVVECNKFIPRFPLLMFDLFSYFQSSLVQQFDFHLPSLTVKETLLFHANLRLPQDTDPLKRLQRVQQVIPPAFTSLFKPTSTFDTLMVHI